MLTRLILENIVIIKALDLDFQSGLNVLTGETGSGKSLILESIHRVFDRRSSPKDLLRHGEARGRIELTFDLTKLPNRPLVNQVLEEAGVDILQEEPELVLSREISITSSRARINGYPVPLEMMERLGRLILEIYGQHDLHNLFSASKQRDLLDSTGGESLLNLSHQVKFAFREMQKQKNTFLDLQQRRQDKERQLDYLTFQLDEIAQAGITDNQEDEQLKSERERLTHAQSLIGLVNQAEHILRSHEEYDSSSVVKMLGQAQKLLNQAQSLDPDFSKWYEQLNGLQEELKVLAQEISGHVNSIDTRPERLNEIVERLDLLEKLKRKYGGSLHAVIETAQHCQQELEQVQQAEAYYEALVQALAEAETRYKMLSEQLSEVRQGLAQKLETAIQTELQDLMLPAARFAIQVKATDYTENGQDYVEFLFSANPGEPLKPLAQVASGGELARVMLALKVRTAQSDNIGTLILDEIDTGMSGLTVRAVAEKLQMLQQACQLIVITHQPILAAKASWHLHVEKEHHSQESQVQVIYLTDRNHRKAILSQLASGFTQDDFITAQFIEQLLA